MLAYHVESPSGKRYHLLVVNASNRQKIVDWLRANLTAADATEISDRTEATAMIAVQGPCAAAIVNSLVDADVTRLKYYQGMVTRQMNKPCVGQSHRIHG